MKYKTYSLSFKKKVFKLKENFTISRGSKTKVESLILCLKEDSFEGYGECVPYKRYGEDVYKITKFLNSGKKINNMNDIPYLSLRKSMSDAIFDLALKKSKTSFFKLLNKKKFNTLITIPITSKSNFIKKVKKLRNIKKIKIKLNEKNVFDFLNILKKYSPKTKVIIDANEGWSLNFFKNHQIQLLNYNIIFIEQPFKSSNDQLIKSKIPLCADESFHLKSNYKKNIKKFKWVNIKPDKFGDDKSVMNAIKFAKQNKLKILLGCMVSSSLSIIPTLRYSKYCDLLDLDGAMFLKNDFKHGLSYKFDNLIYDNKFKYGFKKK